MRHNPDFKRRWCIYGLTDPRTGEIRYVGQTECVRRRYRDHIAKSAKADKNPKNRYCKPEWIGELRQEGLCPGLVVLEWTTARDAVARERDWVVTCILRGHRLTNWQWAQGDFPDDYQI